MIKKIVSDLLKVYIKNSEKRFHGISYLFRRSRGSNRLIIIFSGFPERGNKAGYNYIRTLWKTRANQLFILGNFGYEKEGSYYLGENGNFFIPDKVCRLITHIRKKYGINETITAGSSKGGSAALMYGILCKSEKVVIGAPQYYLGSYLNTDAHKCLLKAIMGNTSVESVEKLNCVLRDKISGEYAGRPDVYIHYSPQEHTYSEHIKDMITDLKANGFTVYEDNEYSYKEHNEVAKYFPVYLIKILSEDL